MLLLLMRAEKAMEQMVKIAMTMMPFASSAMDPIRRKIMKIVKAADMQKCSLVNAVKSDCEEDDDDNETQDQLGFVGGQLLGRGMRLQLMNQFGSKGDQDHRGCQDQTDEDDQDIFDQDEGRGFGWQLVTKV